MAEQLGDAEYFKTKAVLTPKNIDVDFCNKLVLDMCPGEEHQMLSADEVLDDEHQLYSQEFLSTLTPSGLPPHDLRLKVGAPIMLLRNMNQLLDIEIKASEQLMKQEEFFSNFEIMKRNQKK